VFLQKYAEGGMMKEDDCEIRKVDRASEGEELLKRRDFLIGLKKWSKIVIGGALISGALAAREASAGAWVNRWLGGGAWVNGGSAWVNGRGVGGGGSWINAR
jgi:hypothetical protein